MEGQTNSYPYEQQDLKLVYSAVDVVKSRGFEKIKARIAEFENPSKLTQRGTKKSFIPDITAVTQQGKSYFEIVSKSKKDPEFLADKWMLLSSMAQIKNGTFFLMVPHGKYSFTNKILSDYSINAHIIKI